MKNVRKSRYFQFMMAGFGAISLSIAFFFILYRAQGVGKYIQKLMRILSPFIYGGVIAYLLRPICNWYMDKLERILPKKLRGWSNTLSVALSVLTGLLTVYTLIIMIAPNLYYSIQSIWLSLPERGEELFSWLNEKFGENDELINYVENTYYSLQNEIDAWVRNTLIPQLSGVMNIVSGVGQSVVKVIRFLWDVVIGLIVATYLLSSRKKFAKQSVMVIRSIFKPAAADMILQEVDFIDRMFGGFIDGKILDSAIIGCLCYVGCLIFRFPNALLVSAIIGITNVIPYFGPIIGAVPATLFIMLESPVKGLWFILFILVLQQIDGNVIGPKILGEKTGLSSFWVLFSIMFFGGIWGLPGMIVCVPLFAVIYDLVKKLVYRGLRRNECVEVWDEYQRVYSEETAIPSPKDPNEDRGSEIPD